MKTYAAIIIETRPFKNIYEIIVDKHLRFISNEKKDWTTILVTQLYGAIDTTVSTVRDKFYGNPNAKGHELIINYRVDPLTIADYNNLLTSLTFWEPLCKYDRVLIFQSDSSLLRTGVEEFLEDGADWYGAPWSFQSWGGNGGLSLRNPKIMCEVIENCTYNGENEDMFFCNNIEKVGGRLGTREMNSKFSVEAVYALGSMGLHAADVWLSKEQCEEIRNQYAK